MDAFTYIGIGIPLLPAILSLFGWKLFPPEVKTFSLLIWINFINGLAAFIWELTSGTNMPFFHFYILIETILLIRIFSALLHPFISNKVLNTILVTFSALWTFNVLFDDGITGYPTYILAVKGSLLICLAVSWFIKVQRERKIQHPERLFAFWLSTGVLIFFCGNMLLFIFSNFIFVQAQHVYVAIWGTHAILVILLYLIYTIAIIWARKNLTLS